MATASRSVATSTRSTPDRRGAAATRALHGLFLGLHAGHHSHNTYQEVNESRLVWEAAGASGAGWAVQYHGRHRGPLEGARAYPCSAICCLILPGLRRQLRELTLGARTGLQ